MKFAGRPALVGTAQSMEVMRRGSIVTTDGRSTCSQAQILELILEL